MTGVAAPCQDIDGLLVPTRRVVLGREGEFGLLGRERHGGQLKKNGR
jgi:hypothetical protein